MAETYIRRHKACPACAEQILVDAKVCRYCGYDFRRKRMPGLTQGDLAGCAITGCAAWIFWPFLALLLLAAIGSLLPKSDDSSRYEAAPIQPGTVNQQLLNDMLQQAPPDPPSKPRR